VSSTDDQQVLQQRFAIDSSSPPTQSSYPAGDPSLTRRELFRLNACIIIKAKVKRQSSRAKYSFEFGVSALELALRASICTREVSLGTRNSELETLYSPIAGINWPCDTVGLSLSIAKRGLKYWKEKLGPHQTPAARPRLTRQ
jgi:hypothetical protein